MDTEAAARETVDCSFHIYRELGPGLLESVYESILSRVLEQRGLTAERQRAVSFTYAGLDFPNLLKIDLLVEGSLIVELKSVEHALPVHSKQVLTYLRLTSLPLGLLINFGASSFQGCVRRIVNNHWNPSSSRLRIHNPPRS